MSEQVKPASDPEYVQIPSHIENDETGEVIPFDGGEVPDGFTALFRYCQAACAQKPRFECWSTNEGDSWYEHPADAELLYDVLGDSPKVGDGFEVMAGWRSVPARYRIVSQKDDDFEVECISHPEDNTAPQTDYRAQRDALLARLEVINEVHVISATYDRIRSERIFATDDIEYDLFASGWKAAVEALTLEDA